MLRIVTYNLRCLWLSQQLDGINSFVFRSGLILDTLDKKQPDAVFFQEVTEKTSDFLQKHLYKYGFLYHGREEGMHGEGLAIAWNREKLDLLSSETFWLSPTPYIPNSRFENQSPCPRICNVYMLRNKETDEIFRVYNVHLDHINDEARLLGANLMLEKLGEDYKNYPLPVFVLGDFNAKPGSLPIKAMESFENIRLCDLTDKIGCTFHGFGKCCEKIDYIYADENTADKVKNVSVWDECECGIYLSDHYPIEADIEL